MHYEEDKLPEDVRRLANRDQGDYFWKIEDVPTVIAAAREVGLFNLGGDFQVRIPNVMTCEYVCWRVENPPPDDLTHTTWSELVEHGARSALETFNWMVSYECLFEFVRQRHGRTFWNRLFRQAYDDDVLRSSMGYEWLLVTEEEARSNSWFDAQSGSNR